MINNITIEIYLDNRENKASLSKQKAKQQKVRQTVQIKKAKTYSEKTDLHWSEHYLAHPYFGKLGVFCVVWGYLLF